MSAVSLTVVGESFVHDAERRILSALLARYEVTAPQCRAALPRDAFSVESHRYVYEAALAAGSGDLVLVRESLGESRTSAIGGAPFLAGLVMDFSTVVGLDRWIGIVRDSWERSEWHRGLRDVIACGARNGEEFAEAARLLEEVRRRTAPVAQRVEVFGFAEAYADKSPFEPYLVEPSVLGHRDLALVVGPPKAQKSFLVSDLVTSFALGEPWLGGTFRPSRPLCVLVMQFELGADAVRRRLHEQALTDEQVDRLRGMVAFTARCAPGDLTEFGVAAAAAAERCLKQPIDVIVVDPIANVYTGESENDNTQMSAFLALVGSVRDRIAPGAAVMLVHHSSKGRRDDRARDPFDSIRGAGALRGTYDLGIAIDRVSQDTEDRRIHFECRNGQAPPPARVRLEHGRFVEVDEEGEPLIGETAREKWTRAAWAHAKAILDRLRSDACVGRAWTSSAFAGEYGNTGSMGSTGAIKRRASELLQKQILMLCDGRPLGLPTGPRYAGHLCYRGMILASRDGLRDVTPRWHVDEAGSRSELVDPPLWKTIEDFAPDDGEI